jgi:hypothetical protein
MPTPSYQGTNQPPPDTGSWLSALGSIFGFGSKTPAYAGEGQPSPTSSGFFGSATPAYASAPAQPTSNAAPAYPIAPGALAPGQITIVIPRID